MKNETKILEEKGKRDTELLNNSEIVFGDVSVFCPDNVRKGDYLSISMLKDIAEGYKKTIIRFSVNGNELYYHARTDRVYNDFRINSEEDGIKLYGKIVNYPINKNVTKTEKRVL